MLCVYIHIIKKIKINLKNICLGDVAGPRSHLSTWKAKAEAP